MKLALALALLTISATAAAAPGWELHVPERIELAEGESGTLPIEIALDRGQTVSKDAALVLDLAPDGGVSLARRRLGRGDAVDPNAAAPRFAIAVRGEAAGDFTLKLHLRFWVCGSRVCRPADARRTVTVTVSVAKHE